jgi:site-specific DNA-methyltransferase (cytosine-N4-specific)
MKIAYKTDLGVFYNGNIEKAFDLSKFDKYKGRINLIFTSPPFPLNRKKKYGNLTGEKYQNWLSDIGKSLREYLAPNGSIVIEVGNAWEAGSPTMSTLPLKSLLAFQEKGEYHLAQSFIWNNPARLPSPAQWVNVERIRVKDSYTQIWWLSKTARPKANNKRVLNEYSDSMKKLLKKGKYNSGKRPSEHNIGSTSFLKKNKGSIPSNVITASNTNSTSNYLNYCKNNNFTLHPARMPQSIPEFFIKFLTNKNDIVLDPFAGSNTTGAAAESLNRKWMSFEIIPEYILGSAGRFDNNIYKPSWFRNLEKDAK